MTAPDDPLEPFREAIEGSKSDLAEALGGIQARRDDGRLRHWMIVWTETNPEGEDTTRSFYEDAIVGMGLATHLRDTISRSFQDADDEEEA